MNTWNRRLGAGAALLGALLVAGCSSSPAPEPRTPQVVHLTSATGQRELLLRPSGRVHGLVIFMHGLNGNQDQLIDDSGLFPVRNALLAAGYAIVASDAHGNNAGNPVSLQDQLTAARDARRRLGTTVPSVNILAFSMGGLDALLTASAHHLPGLRSVALLSPAVDQRSFLATPYGDTIAAAFGHPSRGQVAAILKRSDPVVQPAASYRGYAYHFWHSRDDGTVPLIQSTAMSRYLATAGIHAPVSRLTGDHGNLTALDPAAIVAFFGDRTVRS